MPRNLIVLMDGTGNEIGDRQTNILRLYRCLQKDEPDQKTIYIPGVGTNDSPTQAGRIWQKIRAICGLAFGLGLEDDVMEAYRFLCINHRPQSKINDEERDEILIFGFSRGAYAARVLAGFIHNVGLMPAHQLHLAPQVFRAYRKITDASVDENHDKTYQRMREYDQVIDQELVPIRFLGIFDTVSSIVRFRRFIHNIKTTGSLLELGTHANVDSNSSVKMVRHAMAIDERRSMFRAQSWVPGPYKPHRFAKEEGQQDVKQVWFPGYHSDIGGSPSEDRAGIGKITLHWMLTEMEAAGIKLTFKKRAVNELVLGTNEDRRTMGGLPYSKPDPLAPIHTSLVPLSPPSLMFFWRFLEFFPKSLTRREWPKGRPGFIWYLPLSEPRKIPLDHPELKHSISESAQTRRKDDPKYDPPNLP
ncbi:MAG: DUF2235 domain-containing protein [Pseudomonadota bacterium]